jgi:hypothetical protein
MVAAIAPPESRNAPCPCGSGRRYKDCHGKVDPQGAGERGGALTGTLVARMHEALAAQREGRFDDAIRAYDAVIAGAPSTFDAWHMRGVAHLQMHRFDEAETDIAQAIAIKPDLPLAGSNLALVASGRRNALADEQVSRAVLPRYRPLVEEADDAPLAVVGAGTRCYILALGAAPSLVDRIAADAASRGAEVVRIAPLAEGGLGQADEARLAATGAGDVVVACGCEVWLGDWTIACAPRAVVLVVDGARLAPAIDRLRELSGQRRRRVRLAVAPDASIDLAPLPHVRLAR